MVAQARRQHAVPVVDMYTKLSRSRDGRRKTRRSGNWYHSLVVVEVMYAHMDGDGGLQGGEEGAEAFPRSWWVLAFAGGRDRTEGFHAGPNILAV